ncbi:cystathionine gamma-lyase [Aliikangiella marina]|uniref:Cystathionine gamma-lyase n=1 Tax=Aliikangiella marina TaxID=1712262 RepID=A0A545TJC5_9GAMM|nr:cystathionine gamma-lyase [Aliikangiella marina]TQV77271.1 cystathionine gamma-lyase [Aliikangiella marina]
MKDNYRPATKIVHAGAAKVKQGEAFNQGPVFASAFHLSGDVDPKAYQYARFHNPTWEAIESGLGDLEGGSVLVFPSGMAAVAAVLTSFVKSGDKILVQSDGYYATRAYAENFLVKFGVEVIAVPTLSIPDQDFSDFKLVFVESPSNPLLDVLDIKRLAEKVHAADGILAIDNTTMTPIGQQPLRLGADISMCSDTKALNGHSDVLFGHVATKNESMLEQMLLWRKLSGNIPGPMETWLVHRGMASLDMRLQRMVNNAQVIAEFLQNLSSVKSVRYPGLKEDPSYVIATEQMQHYGFIISFDLGEKTNADRFLKKAKLIIEATSFGGMHTMAERRARWGTDNVSPGLIRLSVGCEAVEDIIADIALALEG